MTRKTRHCHKTHCAGIFIYSNVRGVALFDAVATTAQSDPTNMSISFADLTDQKIDANKNAKEMNGA